MNKIGSRIYYDIATGNILHHKGEMMGAVAETTIEQDILTFPILTERNRNTFDIIDLPYGMYSEEFANSNGYRVNTTTKQIEFIYGENISQLEGYKEMKIANLKRICEQTIEEGFISSINGHKYRTNRDDQTNFIGKLKQLELKPEITTLLWKTEDVGYLLHQKDDWIAIWLEGLNHKENQLFKYDQLKQQILDPLVDTKEKVDEINWS